MKSVVLSALFFSFILLSLSAKAQKDPSYEMEKEAIEQVIEQLFDAMRQNNGAALTKIFHPETAMKTIGIDEEGQAVLKTGSAQGFMEYVGQDRPENTLDERLISIDIQVDGPMAVAWTPYEFYASGTYSHCGVNVFKLIKNESGWQIFSITDTRRKVNCPQ